MSTRKTVIIKDSKRLKIAASYYRETSSFCPLGHICWCLNPDGTLLSEKYVVFWNQTSSPDGAITYYDEYESADPYEEVFLVQLDLLPAGIKELVFVVKMFALEFSNHMIFSVNLMEYFSFLRQQELVNNMHVYLKPLPDLDADMHWFVTVEFY